MSGMAFCYNLKSLFQLCTAPRRAWQSLLHTAYLLLQGRRGVVLTWRETQEKIKCWTHQHHCLWASRLHMLLSGLFVLPHYGQDQSKDWLEINIICFLLCKTLTLYGRKETHWQPRDAFSLPGPDWAIPIAINLQTLGMDTKYRFVPVYCNPKYLMGYFG